MEYSNNPSDYTLKETIGIGGSARVYIADYHSTNVSVKVIDLDKFERNQIDELRREIQIWSLTQHVNLLPVYASYVTGHCLHIVSPLLVGSVLDVLKTLYPDGLEQDSISTILKQALQGLDYLHKSGLIHRDVKAGNLLIDANGVVQLADFGVSASLMDSGDRRTTRKTFVGTPCWMSPEVMEQSGYDYKADIWSLGITALELATGQAPYAKFPPMKVLLLTLQMDPPTLDRESRNGSTKHKYSRSFKDFIDSCLVKDPTKRPSAEKLLTHSFFRHAKKPSYLMGTLLNGLPPVHMRSLLPRPIPKPIVELPEPEWDFDSPIDEKSMEYRLSKLPKGVSFRLAKLVDEPSIDLLDPLDEAMDEPLALADSLSIPLESSDPTLKFDDPTLKSDDPSRKVDDPMRRASDDPSRTLSEDLARKASMSEPKKSRFVVDNGTSPVQSPPMAPDRSAILDMGGSFVLPPAMSTASLNNGEVKKGRFSVMESGEKPVEIVASPETLSNTLERKAGRFVTSNSTEPKIVRKFTLTSEQSLTSIPPPVVVSPPTQSNTLGDKRGRFQVSSNEEMEPPTIRPSLKASLTAALAPPPTEGSLQERHDALLKQSEVQKQVISEFLSILNWHGLNPFNSSGSGMEHSRTLSLQEIPVKDLALEKTPTQ